MLRGWPIFACFRQMWGAVSRVQNGEGSGLGLGGSDSGGGQNAGQLAGAENGVDLRDVLLNLVAVALHQAAGDDELAGTAVRLVPNHFEDGIDRLLLGGVDERAGVDPDDVGVFGPGGA